MKTELVFILDRSGSMCGLEKDTIGGFNAMLNKQKEEGNEIHITTVLFDNEIEFLYEREDIQNVREMSEKEYFVRGCTALIDAIGTSIDRMVRWQKRLPSSEKAEKVIFVITTDGYENASNRYTRSEVKKMIEFEKEKYNWEFLFLGANIDAVAEAKTFGIEEDRAVTYQNDSEGVLLNYEVASEAITCMNTMPKGKRLGRSWKEKIEKRVK